jgi:hypothetical protein
MSPLAWLYNLNHQITLWFAPKEVSGIPVNLLYLEEQDHLCTSTAYEGY